MQVQFNELPEGVTDVFLVLSSHTLPSLVGRELRGGDGFVWGVLVVVEGYQAELCVFFGVFFQFGVKLLQSRQSRAVFFCIFFLVFSIGGRLKTYVFCF